ncbi:MAG TPA: response regulator transcription factor [Pirellulales bacterium]|jgi:DNA-binding NarL/FixJ family response regulator|nr:response regulator transcription factor [Pirellulales bacterium]
MKPIQVVLADDHRLLRDGIRALLERSENIEVVGEACDGREALARIKEHLPDVLLIDIGMKGMNGLEATCRANREFPSVRVLIVSMHADEEYVLQALQSGASGYVLKDAGSSELEFAIGAVARGETYLTPAISRHIIDNYVRRVEGDEAAAVLTPRHREVLQLIAEGNTTKKIAAILKLGVKTVDTHRTQLMERLDIHDVAGLVRYAIRHRIVGFDA